MGETDPASLTQLPSPWAKLSSCKKRLICLSRTRAPYTTTGLGPLPCLLHAIIEISKLPNGVRGLEYIFFPNAREGDVAAKGSFGREKCLLCNEAYLISGF